MAHNERLKLLADLSETAEKHGCQIPDAAKLIILNDTENRKVWHTDEYVRLPNHYVEELLEQRKETRENLY